MNILKKIITYAVGTVLCRLITYILLPIYTNNFTVAVLGEANMSLSTSTMITSLTYIEVWSAFMRYGFEVKENDFPKVYASTLKLILVLTPFYIIVTLVAHSFLNLSYFVYMMTYGFSLVVFNIEQYLCRIKGKQRLYIFAGVSSACTQLILAFLLLKINRLNPSFVLILPTIGNMVGILIIITQTFKFQRFDFINSNKMYMKLLFVFSLPLSLNSIAYWGMTNIGSYIARDRLGLEANGYISVANKFTTIILLVSSVYILAWQEQAFEHANDKNIERLFEKEFRRFQDLICLVSIVAILGIDIIFPYYIGKGYDLSRYMLPIYFCGTMMNSISSFFGIVYSVAKKNNVLIWSTVIGCFISVASVLLLIGCVGVVSVPIGLFVGMSANVLFRILFMRFRLGYHFSFYWSDISLGWFLILVSFILVRYLNNIWLELFMIAISVLIYFVKWKKIIFELYSKLLIKLKMKENK